MYDAGLGNRQKIPSDAQLVAGHDWTPAMFAQWPRASHVVITTNPADFSADVLDVEKGKGFVWPPWKARGWLAGHNRVSQRPGIIYSNWKWLSIVRATVRGMPYKLWVSDQTGTEHSYPGSDVAATQWFGSRQQNWQGVDISAVSDLSAFGSGSGLHGGGSGGGSTGGGNHQVSPPTVSSAMTVTPGTTDQVPSQMWNPPNAPAYEPAKHHYMLALIVTFIVVVLAVIIYRKRAKRGADNHTR